MEYLLIAFIIVVVLSPLTWLKSTPAQARKTLFRQRASERGLKVQLVPPPDADEANKQPTAVRYCLPYPQKSQQQFHELLGQWMLLRHDRRGWDSPWQGWRWFKQESDTSVYSEVEWLVNSVPDVVYAIRIESNAICLYLREAGEVDVVEQIANVLNTLIKKLNDQHR